MTATAWSSATSDSEYLFRFKRRAATAAHRYVTCRRPWRLMRVLWSSAEKHVFIRTVTMTDRQIAHVRLFKESTHRTVDNYCYRAIICPSYRGSVHPL